MNSSFSARLTTLILNRMPNGLGMRQMWMAGIEAHRSQHARKIPVANATTTVSRAIHASALNLHLPNEAA